MESVRSGGATQLHLAGRALTALPGGASNGNASAERIRPLAPPDHRPPPLRSDSVSRERALRRLLDHSEVPLALLVAPAGYGKSTVLTEWAERDLRPFVWITLEEAHNRSAHLLTSIGGALAELEPIEHGISPAPRHTGVSFEDLRGCLSRVDDFVLVLDEVDVLHNSESLSVLTGIVDHLRAGSQLALAARREPALALGHLRAHHKLIELRSRDLAMTEVEGALLLAAAGLALKPRDVETLVECTEGWPAGLYLAALSLGEQEGVTGAAQQFGGDDRLVTDYLLDELLSPLSEDEFRFLTRTSMLDRLSGSLCDAVLERSGSATVLRAMSRSNLLLVPVDRNDESYRYHGLLGEALRGELHRREPEREAGLHLRAVAWYVEHDDPDRAINHALAAGDRRRAASLMRSNALRYTTGGGVLTMKHWLEWLGDAEVTAHARLAFVVATCHLTTCEPDLVERWASAAARAVQRAGPADSTSVLEAGMAILRAAGAREGIGRMARYATRAYELDGKDNPWRSLCCLLDGVARHLAGDRKGGRDRLAEGSRRAEAANIPNIHALCLAQLAVLTGECADASEEDVPAVRARSLVDHAGLAESPGMALVFAVSAAQHASRGRVEEAADDTRRSVSLLAAGGEGFAPWYQVETRAVLARGMLRLGDVGTARRLLTEASRYLRRTSDAVVLRALLDETWGEADTALESHVLGPSSLTPAELRVLRLLPTHLAFREIAARLHISTNTVKTQAHAVYRKLDASSRSEAVDNARGLGFLEAHEIPCA